MSAQLLAKKYSYTKKEYKRLVREERSRQMVVKYLQKNGIVNVDQLVTPTAGLNLIEPDIHSKAVQCDIDLMDNKFFEEFHKTAATSRTMAETELKMRSQMSAIYEDLKLKLRLSRKEEAYWRCKLWSIEYPFADNMADIKRKRWCAVCSGAAKRAYNCCPNGYYCCYIHRKTHRFHTFKCCRN